MARPNSKEQILDAAECVVMDVGAAHMSLDMVARRAGVSKGGLLYHFPGKEDLLKAMIDRMVREFYKERERGQDNFQPGRGRFLKAGILAALDCGSKKERMRLSMLAATAESPDLLHPIRDAYREHVDRLLSSGMPFERAAVVSLASDGLMFNEMLKLSPFSPLQRRKIKDEMIRMIEEMESPKK